MDEEALDLLRSAFREVDLDVVAGSSAGDRGVDAVIDAWGLGIRLHVKRLSLVSVKDAQRLISDAWRPSPSHDVTPVVVANRITEEARETLVEHGWGYLDLRGQLELRVPGRLVVRSDVQPAWSPAERSHALSGKAGLEVAAALLMDPRQPQGVRELARRLRRSPSTVSQIAQVLRHDDLVEDDLRVSSDRLFWELAEHWTSKRTYLVEAPRPGDLSGATLPLKLGLEEVESTTGWALTDTAAAAALGAPVASRLDQPLDFFVPDELTARRARSLLQVATSRNSARCSIRVAPVPAVCDRRVDVESSYLEWPLAHPLFVALDLAQDKGRGREILRDWTPQGRWDRVW